MNRIQISNISKQYKDIKALDHIYCTFESGRIYGLSEPFFSKCRF